MKVYGHVIFDLDGTLVDSLDDLTAAINHVRAGLALPPLRRESVAAGVGEGARRLVERTVETRRPEEVDAALVAFLEYYGAHALDRTRLYPGMGAVIERLRRRGVRLSVLSNKPAALSRAILGGLGVLPCFVAVIGGDTLPARKPDPAGVHSLCLTAMVEEAETVLVGDSLVDARTAGAAGVGFIGVAWGLRPDELRRAGMLTIERPRELLALVRPGRSQKR
jgi:phosphoglycolate phosphatase